MPTALVVGASGTLGGAIARELLAHGFDAGLHYCARKETCEALAASAPAHARCYAADFKDPQAPGALAQTFLKDFSRIDALVWASGLSADAPLLALSEESLRLQLQLDLKAFFLLAKACARQFIRQKSGAVVTLSSRAGVTGRAGGVAYAMAHSGLQALVKSLAREWGPLGVSVNAVLPPFVAESAMGASASPEFAAKAQARRVLKNQIDAPAAVASFVREVLTNPAISGQILAADSRIY